LEFRVMVVSIWVLLMLGDGKGLELGLGYGNVGAAR